MKYRILIIWGLLFSVSISNQSCQHKKPKNTYLGEIPAIAEFYQKKIKDLEQKTDNCSSLEKAYEYAVRAKNFKKEAAIKIGTAFAKLPDPVTVPVVQDTVQRAFTVKEVVVTSAALEELRIEAPVYFQDSILLPKAIHLQMVNQGGESCQSTVVLARTGSVGNQQTAKYSGVLQHPENCNRLEAFKIIPPGLSGL